MTDTADFRQLLCGGCGYSLRGHAISGRCPECGETYSPDNPVILGWFGSTSRKSRKGVAMGCSSAVAALFALAMIIGVAVGSYIIGVVYLVLTILALSWFPLYRRATRRRRPTPNVQVRLTPEGYGQRSGFGTVQIFQWAPNVHVTLSQQSRRWYRLQISRRTNQGKMDIGTMVDIQFRASPAAAEFIGQYINRCMQPHLAPPSPLAW